jgi:hypothetical protein
MPPENVHFRCTRCGRRGKAPAAAAGKSGRCGYCSTPMTVPDTVASPRPAAPPASSPPEGEWRADAPSPRRQQTRSRSRPSRAWEPAVGAILPPGERRPRRSPRAVAAIRFAERSAAAFSGGLMAGVVLLLIARAYLPESSSGGAPLARGEMAVSPDPDPPPVEWATAPGEAQTLGHATVEVTDVSVGRAKLKVIAFGGDQERETDEQYLIVRVRVSTASPARKVDYRSWGDVFGSAEARDDAGNEYDRGAFGFGATPVGRTVSGTAVREKPVEDVLFFDRPVDTARRIDLTLPGSGVRQPGSFHFRIERAAWENR